MQRHPVQLPCQRLCCLLGASAVPSTIYQYFPIPPKVRLSEDFNRRVH